VLYGYCLELSAEGLPFAPFTGVPRLIGNQRVLNDVMIVITFVPTSWTGHTPLRPALAELDRLGWVARLDLPRLTRREGRELAASLLGGEAHAEHPRAAQALAIPASRTGLVCGPLPPGLGGSARPAGDQSGQLHA
jgi:hypothetical protein